MHKEVIVMAVCLNLRATVRRDSLLIRMALCALFPLLLDACGVTDYRPYPSFDRVEIVADSVPVVLDVKHLGRPAKVIVV